MRPLALKGHERALTRIRLNREGDLLFSASKDKFPAIWYTENGERLGTYNGHNGVVWDLDVSWDSRRLLTGSGDNTCKLWDTQTGRELCTIKSNTTVRAVGFSYSGNLFFFTNAKQMQHGAALNLFDARDPSQINDGVPYKQYPFASQANAALWSQLDDTIVTGHDGGLISQFDLRSSGVEPVNFVNDAHRYAVTDLQLSQDQTMLISSSRDKTARLFDAQTLDVQKLYKSERPVNSAAISPTRDHIVLGGGEDAMTVTQTAVSAGHFEAKFYHMVFEDEFARVKGHFGPINTLAFHPDGNIFLSGGEDGYIRIQEFDEDYLEFDFDY